MIVVPVAGPNEWWVAWATAKLNKFGFARAIVTGGRYASSIEKPSGTPIVILGLPNTGESEVSSLFWVKHAPVCSRAGSGLGTYSPSAPNLTDPARVTVGAVAMEKVIGAV